MEVSARKEKCPCDWNLWTETLRELQEQFQTVEKSQCSPGTPDKGSLGARGWGGLSHAETRTPPASSVGSVSVEESIFATHWTTGDPRSCSNKHQDKKDAAHTEKVQSREDGWSVGIFRG